MGRGLALLAARGSTADTILEVAAVNHAGLSLYRRFGFAIDSRLEVHSLAVTRTDR